MLSGLQGETVGYWLCLSQGPGLCLLSLDNNGLPVFEPLPAAVKKSFASFNFPSNCYKSVIITELFGFSGSRGAGEKEGKSRCALGHTKAALAWAPLL